MSTASTRPALPLLVGELNPYGADPRYALYPRPRNATGDRLCRLMGLGELEYLRRFERVNLCTGKWSLPKAREAAGPIAFDAAVLERPLVLLGARVCAAFGVEYRPSTWSTDASGFRQVVLAHPSGLNRHWNQPGAYARARAVLVEAGVLSAPEARTWADRPASGPEPAQPGDRNHTDSGVDE